MPPEGPPWTALDQPSADGGMPAWARTPIDTRTPSLARCYDVMLDGKDNFAVDRATAEAVLAVLPDAPQLARDNRAWLARVTRHLVEEAGIRQIIDIGSGLPTTSNIHDFAQRVAPETNVVYVDNDPIVFAHGQAILAINEHTTVITADVTEPDSIFVNEQLEELIDLQRPFAVILAGVLHHIPTPKDQRVAADLRDRLSPGSYLAISNFCDPGDPRAAETERAILESGLGSGWFRPYPQHRMYLGGLDLVAPGLCPVNEWRPDEHTTAESPAHHLCLGGVGHRPT